MQDFLLADGFAAAPHRFLWHEASATAVLSDLHLGAEAELNRRGILMPEVSIAAMQAAWTKVCDRLNGRSDSRLLVAGDLFDVDAPDARVIAQAVALLQALPAHCRVTVIPGNHDPAPEILHAIFAGFPVAIAASATVGGYTVIHGHDRRAAPDSPVGLIVGHQHPAVVVRNRVQSAKMFCFANCGINRGKIEAGSGREEGDHPVPLILLPAFSRAPLGSNLLTDRNWILDLPRPADEQLRILGIVEGAARDPQVLDFGTLAGLRLPF